MIKKKKNYFIKTFGIIPPVEEGKQRGKYKKQNKK